LSENLIQNDGVEIPAKPRRPVVVPIEAPPQAAQYRNSRWYYDPDFVVAISQSTLREGGFSIPSFDTKILRASHNLPTETLDEARMATAT
jgi:hypothetical protein